MTLRRSLLSAHLVGIFREFQRAVRRGDSKTRSGLSPEVFREILKIRDRFPLDKALPYREKVKKSRIINCMSRKIRPSALLSRQQSAQGHEQILWEIDPYDLHIVVSI